MQTVPAKTIITRQKQGANWFGIDYNMNLYRGCCHGCIYCDSRSDCYHIEHFSQVRAKENALTIIRDELRRKVRPGVVATGAMSDPYNPFEKTELLTRHALELLGAYGFGVAIDTKSDLVVRDIDLLQELAAEMPVIVKLSITTADDALSRKVEPHVALSSQRFAALGELSRAGIFCGVLMMPILPFLEDSRENIQAIVEQTAQAGARFIYPAMGLTMRDGQREYFYEKLEEAFPGQRLPEQYQSRYGSRYQCSAPHAGDLYRFFTQQCDKYGLLYEMTDIIRAYKLGYGSSQLSFFQL